MEAIQMINNRRTVRFGYIHKEKMRLQPDQ